jgi:hypothetical protein
MLQMLVYGHQRATPIILINFPVAEDVRALQQLLDEPNAPLVVARQVVPVREVERIDVVLRLRVATVDNLCNFR